MLKKKYYLLFFKKTGTGHFGGHQIGLPMYRKNKKFHVTHAGDHRCLLNIIQVYWWYFLIKYRGKKNTSMFAYKNPNGSVHIKKL